jgi:hypothetical protein
MTRLKTILNKYKETRMAKPKFRMMLSMDKPLQGAGASPSIGDIIKERETTHGDFEMKAIFIQEIMEDISGLYIWKDMSADQKESIHMIIAKLSRIIYGNPNHADHWIDIAGYAKLVSDRLENKK